MAGWVLVLGPLPASAVGLGLGLRGDDAILAGIGLYHLWFALALLLVRRAQSHRRRAAEGDAPTTSRIDRLGRVLAVLGGILGVLAPWWPSIARWTGEFLPWASGLLGSLPLLIPGGAPDVGGASAWAAAAVFAVSGVALALLAPYLSQLRASVLPDAPGLARWCRGAVWLNGVGAVGCVLHALSIQFGHGVVAAVVVTGLVVLGAELCVRGLRRRVPPPDDDEAKTSVDPAFAFVNVLSLRLLASRFNPSASLFGVLAAGLGIDLKSAWALGFVRRSMAPLAALLLVVGWACTGLVSIDTHERGVHERFGRLHSTEPLEPGLHLILPWPIDRVERVSVDRVRQTTIGYRGQRDGTSMLWTSTHAELEHKLLVGDGRDVVSINAVLYYQVGDPLQFLYTSENPEQELEAIADRVLMRRTIERSLDQLLGESLDEFAAAAEDEIRQTVRDRRLGLEVVDFSLNGLHPPVDVAPDYQAVVSSRIDRSTRILEAQRYRVEQLPGAEGSAFRTLELARADAILRTSRAAGEALAFTAVLRASAIAPGLFQFRRHLEVLEQALEGQQFHVVDHRILRDGGTLWLLD